MGGHGALSARSEDDRVTSTLPDDTQHAQQSPTRSHKRPLISNERTNTSIRNTPTTFSLRCEDEIDQSRTTTPPYNAPEDSSFGIRSFESSLADLDTASSSTEPGLSQTHLSTTLHGLQQHTIYPAPSSASPPEISEPSSPQSLRSSPLLPLTRESSVGALSGPLTPYHLRSPYRDHSSDPSSTPRSTSLRSLQLSDEDAVTDSESHSVESDHEGEHVHEQELHMTTQSMPTPELVMPSMSIPRRRPFTESGRRMGKLTIAITGRPGSGKKSLLRALVQSWEDIVHIDAPPTDQGPFSRTTASTRPYPTWWSESEGLRPALQRRRSGSLNDAILERNISFLVASTTFSDETSSASAIVEHFEQQYPRILDLTLLDDREILDLLSGNGGSHIDLVLYVLPASPDDTDIQALADLSKLATLVPILGQADTFSEDEIRVAVTSIQQILRSHSVDIPNLSIDPSQTSDTPIVWPVSSASSTDDDNMDASLLMDSAYIQPLVPSGLSDLVRTIFNPDNAARLRHLSARKFLAWRRTHTQSSSPQNTAAEHQTTNAPASSILSSPSASQVLVSRPNVSTGSPAYALTRWATDLQQSLRNERDRYQRVPSEDRRGWLIERWRNSDSPAHSGGRKHNTEKAHDLEKADLVTGSKNDASPLNHCAGPLQDPLGLLACNDMIRRNGTIIARILGGCGILGAIALWAMKTWGWGSNDEAGHWGGGWSL